MQHGPEVSILAIICFALTVGAAMRMASGRLRVPYTVAMLLVGIATGLLVERFHAVGGGAGVLGLLAEGSAISAEIIILVFLPVLVFEASFSLEVHAFRRNFGAVVIPAVVGMLASTAAIALLMVGATSPSWHWGWLPALVFGALISATDPVAVVALLREMGAPRRLGLLIEGESLLNDGTAIVVFTVLLGLLTGAYGFEAAGTLLHFLWVTAGGLAVGLALAIAVTHWLSRTFNAPLIEITLTVVLAYVAMLVSEQALHVSGVIAVVAAGLWMSGRGRVHISPEVSGFLHRFWEMLSYLANTLIFFLVGLLIATQVGDAAATDLILIAVAFAGIVGVRFVVAFLLRPLINRVSDPISPGETTVMAWSGLRGAVSLALALVASQHPDVSPELGRQILLATAGVVSLTIMINGSTVGWLLRRLGFDRPPPADRLAELMARSSVLTRVGHQITGGLHSRDLRTVDWSEVNRDLEMRRMSLDRQIEQTRRELESAEAGHRVGGYWRQALNVERRAFWTAFARGTLSAQATRILDHEIDLQLDRLARDQDSPLRSRSRELPAWRARLARWMNRPGHRFGRLQFELLTLRYDLYRGEQLAAERVLSELEGRREIDGDVRERIRATYTKYLHASKERLEDLRANLPEVTRAIETRLARRIQLNFERESYEQLARSGSIDSSRAAEALNDVERRMKALQWSHRDMELPETRDLCRHAPLFSELDDEALEMLAVLTIEKALAPNELLFRQGERGDSMFIIARGAVAVIRERRGDHGEWTPVILDILGGGDILGEMALLSDAPRVATARAVTTVTVGEISRRAFDDLTAGQPRLRQGIWESFARRSFDNHLRDLPGYEHLGHDDRVGWFKRGRLIVLEVGDPVPAQGEGFAFVVTGALQRGGESDPRTGLVALRDAGSLRAREKTHLAVLPPFSESG